MRFEVLTEDDVERIDKATMSLLGTTGVAVYEKHSRDLLRDEGAKVDEARSRIRIPEKVIRAVSRTR